MPTPQPVELGECIGVQLGAASNDNLLLYWTTYPWPDTESWTETAGGLACSSTTALQYASHPLRNGTQGGYGVPLAIYMLKPEMGLWGDSLMRGPSYNDGAIPVFTPYIAENIFGVSCAAGGIGSTRIGYALSGSGSIAAQFQAYALSTNRVSWAIVNGGINDHSDAFILISYGSEAAALNDFTNSWAQHIMLPAKTNGVYVVANLMWPENNDSTNEMNCRVTWNAALQSMVNNDPVNFSNVLLADLTSTLGAYRSDGPTGNLLGLKTSYSLDGLHLNQAGYTAVMQYIYAQAIP